MPYVSPHTFLKLVSLGLITLDGKLTEQGQQSLGDGIAAIVGKWPGDETDEEIRQALDELS